METLDRVTWLFLRGDETIRVKLATNGLLLAANGPRYEQRVFRFGDETTAKEFFRLYEQDLTDSGWILQGFVERRTPPPNGVFPAAGDRRRRQEVAH